MYELTKEYLPVVKLTGPGLGQKATGSLAGQLTFSDWKGKAYLKKHAKPKQPRTAPQVSMRAMMTFLSQQWSAIAPADQATWNDLAAQTVISPFNAYQKTNLQRWRNYEPPTKAYPAAAAGTQPDVQNYATVCHGNYANLRVLLGALNDGWAVNFHAKLAGPLPNAWNYLIRLNELVPSVWNEFDFYPTEPGTWWFFANTVTTDGQFFRPQGLNLAQCVLT